MNTTQEDIKKLTDSAIRSDGTPLCEQLKPLVGFEERYAILHAIAEQNKLDRKDNPAIPKLDLYLETGTSQRLGMTLAGQIDSGCSTLPIFRLVHWILSR